MEKIQMKTPLVEMDGDEMTRVLWQMIKDELLCPFIDLKTEYYDLGLLHRNETRDQVTVDAALATKKYGVAVKCATITPNAQRMIEYPQLTEMWKSRTEPSGRFSTAQSSARRSCSTPSDLLCATGKSPSPSRVMLTATYISPSALKRTSRANAP